MSRSCTAPAVRVYAVVSEVTEKAVGLFVRLEQAERFLEDVRTDEPELAERLRIEPVDLSGATQPATSA